MLGPWSSAQTVAVTASVVLGAWSGRVVVATMVAAVVAVLWHRPDIGLACLLLAGSGAVLAGRSWHAAQPRHLGPYDGWVSLASDPETRGAAVHVVVEIEGERFDAWIYGAKRRRFDALLAGDRMWVQAERRQLSAQHRRRAQVRHVVGRVELEVVADRAPTTALARSANAVRRSLRRAAEQAMPREDAALFTGLVVGDDARQSPETVAAFRAAGMSHLTAVSGQNVAFVLAACSPLLRRLRPLARWSLTLAVIAWFAALTRFEPSVLRASVMAAASSWAFVTGRERAPLRVLCLAVVTVVLVDPMLVWSVALWLSVGATAGVVVVGPRLERCLRAPRWLAAPLAVTLGAQAGVALPSLLVFGRLPLVSVPANLLAVPAAGFVMLSGLPAALLAAHLPSPVADLVLMPSRVATRWVSVVAQLGSRLEPARPWGVAGWAVVVAAVVAAAGRRRQRADVPAVPI